MNWLTTLRARKALFAAFVLIGFVVAAGIRSSASVEPEKPMVMKKERAPSTGLLLDLGNETCPVMGGEVNGEDYIEWNHLRVGFCCAGCDERFLADPEKALDAVSADWREAVEAARDGRLDEVSKRWKVLREE